VCVKKNQRKISVCCFCLGKLQILKGFLILIGELLKAHFVLKKVILLKFFLFLSLFSCFLFVFFVFHSVCLFPILISFLVFFFSFRSCRASQHHAETSHYCWSCDRNSVYWLTDDSDGYPVIRSNDRGRYGSWLLSDMLLLNIPEHFVIVIGIQSAPQS
jgi:hypothetical protein